MATQKKKIAIIIRSLELGGAEKQSILLANALCHRYQVHYFIQLSNHCDEKFTNLLNNQEITIHKLKGGLIKRVRDIASITKRNRIHLIFTYLMIDNIAGSAIKLLFPRVKIMGGVRNCYLPFSKFIINKYLHRLFHTKTIFNNSSGREYYISKGFKETKSIVIRNTMEKLSPPVKREQQKQITILTVGRFVPQKDYHTALKAIAILASKDYHFKYKILGYGKQEQQIRHWVSKYKLTDYTEVIIKPNNLDDHYQGASIYLCSSIFEGLSNTIMEAMNYSLPVVATNVGDNSSLIQSGINGYITPPGHPKSLAEHLEILIKSFDIRNQYGKASHLLLREKFSTDTFAKNYIQLIEREHSESID